MGGYWSSKGIRDWLAIGDVISNRMFITQLAGLCVFDDVVITVSGA